MLVWLAEHLVKYYSGFNVFSYLTFRAIVSLLTALFISLWMGPRMIARLQKLSFGQVVRNDGCLLYTSPSPRDRQKSRMPSSA